MQSLRPSDLVSDAPTPRRQQLQIHRHSTTPTTVSATDPSSTDHGQRRLMRVQSLRLVDVEDGEIFRRGGRRPQKRAPYSLSELEEGMDWRSERRRRLRGRGRARCWIARGHGLPTHSRCWINLTSLHQISSRAAEVATPEGLASPTPLSTPTSSNLEFLFPRHPSPLSLRRSQQPTTPTLHHLRLFLHLHLPSTPTALPSTRLAPARTAATRAASFVAPASRIDPTTLPPSRAELRSTPVVGLDLPVSVRRLCSSSTSTSAEAIRCSISQGCSRLAEEVTVRLRVRSRGSSARWIEPSRRLCRRRWLHRSRRGRSSAFQLGGRSRSRSTTSPS